MIDGKQTMISAFWGSHFGISPLKRDKIVPLGLSIKSHMGPIKINPSKIEMGPASLIKNYLLDPFRSFTFGNTWDCVAVVFEKFFCFSLQICVCVCVSQTRRVTSDAKVTSHLLGRFFSAFKGTGPDMYV